MTGLEQVQTVTLLLIAVLALKVVARRLLVPYPILLVVGGLVLALVPGLPPITLAPDLVFLVFLPPILWAAAYFTSLRDFWANIRPISLLAVGLVVATTAVVAVVARAVIPGMPWAAAVTLGAIVSPTDAVAVTALASRLGIPRRIVTILEGESLVNDASALILYRAAVAALAGGGFTASEVAARFVVMAAGGVAIGLAVGAVVVWVLRWIKGESLTEIALTLLAPYIAWVLADQAGVSQVLACVAGGLYLRRQFSAVVAPVTRVQARTVWELLVFILNGVLFILIGLQLRTLSAAVPADRLGLVLWQSAAVSLACIATRLVWVPLAAAVPRWLSPALRARDPMPPASTLFLVGWVGMRGVVSLAAALALPFTTAAGTPFPFREEIILVTFGVILATLVIQGLTLSPIVRALRLPPDDTLEREEMLAREQAAIAALSKLDELSREPWALPGPLDRRRTQYAGRLRRFSRIDTSGGAQAAEAAAARRLRHAALEAERAALIRLRNDGVISDDVLQRLENELDVEAIRLGAGDVT